MLTKKLESFDFFVIIPTNSFSTTLSVTRIGLITLSISVATACGFLIGNNVIHELVMQKQSEYKKQHQKDQQTISSCDKLNRKSLQDSVIVKKISIVMKYF